MNSVNVNVRQHLMTIRKAVTLAISPHWLPVLIIFVFLYTPFLLKYGWGYRSIPNVDLPSFYSASVAVFEHGESPYDRERLQALMGQDVYTHPYLYPPPSLLFFYPLSALDYATARHIVLLGNHLIILSLLFVVPLLLLRASSDDRFRLTFVLTCVYSLTFFPTAVTLNHGQVNLLLLAFILTFWLLDRAGYAISASLFLALAVFLKTYPIIILAMLLVTGRRRECAYTSAWLGLGTIISLMVFPSAIWHEWIVNVLPTGGYTQIPAGLFSPAAIWNQSLNGFFARAFTESQWSIPILVDTGLARTMTYAAAGLVTAISGMAVLRGSMGHPDSLDRTMLVALPTMYLLAPLSWEHHLVYLLPSILMLLTARSRLPTAATLVFFAASIGAALLIGLDRGLRFKFWGVVVLWALCIFTACSKHIRLPNNGIESDE
jgi:hypothetical protein